MFPLKGGLGIHFVILVKSCGGLDIEKVSVDHCCLDNIKEKKKIMEESALRIKYSVFSSVHIYRASMLGHR